VDTEDQHQINMEILNKPISSFVFDDIVVFCKEGNVEGFQLDYKREIPPRGLAKHFASFSNSRGGLIIIGVSEDKSGRPEKFDGIKLDTKTVDRIHQYSTSVEPRPLYDLHVTNEENGKVFVLVRIYEGDRTPYYVQNDPNIYIRTGNITDPIGQANPETVKSLFDKNKKADLARRNYIFRAEEIYKVAVERAEKERIKLIAIEKNNYGIQAEKAKQQGEVIEPYRSKYLESEVGEKTSMLTLYLQPFFPGRTLILPKEIIERREQLRFTSSRGDFPNYSLKPIQDGVINFEWGQNNGCIKCHQLYSKGLLYFAEDVLRQDIQYGKRIYIETIASNIYVFLKAASIFYKNCQYQGLLVGKVQLKKIGGAKMKRIVPNGWRSGPFWDTENEIPLMDDYEWDLEVDTSLIDDSSALQTYFINFIKEIYWSFGYDDLDEKLMKGFLKDNGWLGA